MSIKVNKKCQSNPGLLNYSHRFGDDKEAQFPASVSWQSFPDRTLWAPSQESCTNNSTWKCALQLLRQLLIIIFPNDRIIHRLGADTEEHEQTPTDLIWICLPLAAVRTRYSEEDWKMKENLFPSKSIDPDLRQDFKEQISSPVRPLSRTDDSGFERQAHASTAVSFYYPHLRR